MENKQSGQTTSFNTRLPQKGSESPSTNKGDDLDYKLGPKSEEFSDDGTGMKA